MFIATIVLSALLALTFLGAGVPKVIGAKQSLQMRDQVRVGADLWRVIGALEIAAALGLVAGLAVPVLGIAAAIGLALLLIGGIAAHVRVDDLRGAAPAAILLVVAVATAVVRFRSM
jgi:DoxX-like protein